MLRQSYKSDQHLLANKAQTLPFDKSNIVKLSEIDAPSPVDISQNLLPEHISGAENPSRWWKLRQC